MSPTNEYTTVKNTYVTLNNGEKMPVLGLGTWKGKPGEVEASVQTALRVGYRHIDCAKAYGNQTGIGQALQDLYKEGKVSRKDFWLTTKLWNTDHGEVRKNCLESMKELQTEYLDLYLVHWPVTPHKGSELTPSMKDTWQQMEKLVEEGLVKSIGISNFSVKKVEDLLQYAKIAPAVNQVELHPYFRNEKLHKYCDSKKIHLTAYSPLGTPDSAAQQNRSDQTPHLMSDPSVKKIADKHGKHTAPILIRWAIQNGTSVIPKATGVSHIQGNLDALNFELTPEEFQAIGSLKLQMRMLVGAEWLDPAGPYKTAEELWDGEVPEENLRLLKEKEVKPSSDTQGSINGKA
ncbi:hypothetical protein ABBQ38_000362 [Trebouxia sp. C0009 RCD-2024]